MKMSYEKKLKQVFDSWIRAYPLSNKTDVEVCHLLPKVQKDTLEGLGEVTDKIREIFDEDMFNKMNKEQDKRQKSGELGYFPYYVVEGWLNDLKKAVLGLLVKEKENQRK